MTNIKASQDVLDYCKSNNYELVVNIEDKFIVYKNNDYYYFFIWDSRVGGYEHSGGDIEDFCMGNLLDKELAVKLSKIRIGLTSVCCTCTLQCWAINLNSMELWINQKQNG